MTWYFLSTGDFGSSLTEVRTPQMAYQESTTPRLCIAPTVSQCILALAAMVGKFNVYSIDVRDPAPADESVNDRDHTDEHWITQEVLDAHGGSIPINKLGVITIDGEMRLNLKVNVFRNKMPDGWESRENKLWKIADGVWTPNFININEVRDLLR